MNFTIAAVTARGLVGRRRFLLLLPLPLMLVGLTVLARSADPDVRDWGSAVLVGLGLAVVLPLVALIVGTGVLGMEIDDGTLLHILTKPLPRREIVITKLVVASAVCIAVGATALFVAGAIADGVRLGAGFAAGGAVAAVAYSALFAALSTMIRRPVLAGLLYILIWEGMLGNLLSGTAVLSIQQYAVTIAARVSGTDLLDSTVSLPVAVVMSAVFVAAGAVLATERLRSFSVAGETG